MQESMHIKFGELEELEKHRRDEDDEILKTQLISEKVDEENLIPITTQSQSPPRSWSWRLVDYHPHNQITKSPDDKDCPEDPLEKSQTCMISQIEPKSIDGAITEES